MSSGPPPEQGSLLTTDPVLQPIQMFSFNLSFGSSEIFGHVHTDQIRVLIFPVSFLYLELSRSWILDINIESTHFTVSFSLKMVAAELLYSFQGIKIL